MKKINILLSVALLLAGVSCAQLEKTVFHPSDATAPVMGTVTPDGKSIVFEYTPGTINLATPVYHTAAIVEADGRPVSYSLKPAEVKGTDGKALPNVFSVKLSDIGKGLITLGFPYNTEVIFKLAVRMSMQSSQADNSVNGYLDSESTWAGSVKTPEEPKEDEGGQADPYAGWTESDWGVTGSIASAGLNWDKDITMLTDGTWHVARGVVLTTADEFKFRKYKEADPWAINFGGTFESLDAEFTVEQGGPNIKVTEDGTYDLLLNPDGTVAKITLAKTGGAVDPYAGWDESDWGVTGSIASAGINWDKDITMLTDGTWHVARGVVLTTSDEFKFRKYKEADPWAINFGGDFAAFDEEFDVTQGGPNIKVTEDGTYDLLLNPDGSVAKVIPAQTGGSDPYSAFGDESDWGVTGSIASAGINWDKDVTMVTDGTWHVAKGVELTASDEFKFRMYKESDPWATNFGGDFAAFGEEFEVTQGGPNIKVTEDGTYDLLLNPDEAVAKVVKSGEDPGI